MVNALIPFRKFDELLDSWMGREMGYNGQCDGAACVTPRADILEGEKDYVIRLDLPGVNREDLNIELEDNTLTISAQRNLEAPEGYRYLHGEQVGKALYRRTFTLGRGIDGANISAKLDRGSLTVTLPKSEQALARRIEVK